MPPEDWVLVGTTNGQQWLQPTWGGRSTWWGVRMEPSWVSTSPLLSRALAWMTWSTAMAYLLDHAVPGTWDLLHPTLWCVPQQLPDHHKVHTLGYQITYWGFWHCVLTWDSFFVFFPSTRWRHSVRMMWSVGWVSFPLHKQASDLCPM